MADIDIHRTHDLGLEAARVAADKMLEDLARKFSLRGHWTGDTLHFERPGVTGSLAVTGRVLRLTVTLGFLLKALKGSLERAILDELEALFAMHEKPAAKARPAKAPEAKKSAVAKPATRKETGGRKKAG